MPRLPPPQPPPLPLPLPPHPHHHHNLLPLFLSAAAAVAVVVSLSILVVFFFILRRRHRRQSPSATTTTITPIQFPYSTLRRATSSFSPSRLLGRGSSGSVFSAKTLTINSPSSKITTTTTTVAASAAVKLMDSGSLHALHSFHNEILISTKTIPCPHIVRLLGFSSHRRPRRMCLVYELLENGNLQECLLYRKCEELMDWGKRFGVAVDIAKGLEFLHHECEPGIVHGDVKPSNVLLDGEWRAKVSDFGLARFKVGENENHLSDLGMNVGNVGNVRKRDGLEDGNGEDVGSVGETESVTTTTVGFDDVSVGVGVGVGLDRSPEGNLEASPEMGASLSFRVDHEVQVGDDDVKGNGKEVIGNEGLSSRKVKDYVMEWIGSEVKKERPLGGWIGGSSSSKSIEAGRVEKKKKVEKRLEWWVTMDGEKGLKKEKRKTVREWWKEEYAEELERRKKKKKKEMALSDVDQDTRWPRDDAMYHERKRSGSRKSSRSSLDRWLDGLGSDHGRFHGGSHDSGSGEIPKSGGLSSTPSMRGTVCYIAPEYSAGGDLSEKCDVYSYGVLLLVLIAGRRPLQVTSPVSEYRRANLISWARRLARKGRLLDLVDKKIHSLNNEQAQLCIMVALACLQKSPGSRPSMKEVVGMLTGELDSPVLPMEFSPSPPSRLPYKSQKNPR